jgi:hypothetical protein
LSIKPLEDLLALLDEETWLSGPGLRGHEARLADYKLVDETAREPGVDGLLQLALKRLAKGERDDFWKAEPLYLRPSAAEEKWLERASC